MNTAVIEGVLETGTLNLVSTETPNARTKIINKMAMCVSCGVPWADYFVNQPARVLYIQAESQQRLYNAAVAIDARHFDAELLRRNLTVQEFSPPLDLSELEARAIEFDVVILSPLHRLMPMVRDADCVEFLHRLYWLARKTGVAIIVGMKHSIPPLNDIADASIRIDLAERKPLFKIEVSSFQAIFSKKEFVLLQ